MNIYSEKLVQIRQKRLTQRDRLVVLFKAGLWGLMGLLVAPGLGVVCAASLMEWSDKPGFQQFSFILGTFALIWIVLAIFMAFKWVGRGHDFLVDALSGVRTE